MSELRERELRDLLERVSAIDGEVDVDEHWVAGRRRRTRRGAGIAVVTGMALVVAAGAVAQTGLLGGSEQTPAGPAAVPDALDTFVFAATDATGALDETGELDLATEGGLLGTQWVLRGEMWDTDTVSSDLTGTTAPTVLTFADEAGGGAWSVNVAGCGVAQVPRLQLDERGRFPGVDVLSTTQTCAEDVQAAEDFWMSSLSGGGTFTLLDDGRWLLLSVDAPAPPSPDPTTRPQPTPTAEPGEDEDPGDDGTAAPGDEEPTPGEGTTAPPERTTPPQDDGTAAPGTGTDGTAPPTSDPDAAPPPALDGRPFLQPGEESVDQPWPAAGGELFAPTVRAGVHEGFDRVVVDLTGSGDLGWRAAYTTDPRLDGSGEPSDIAGDSVLELWLTGMAYPEPGSDVYSEGIFGLDTHTLGAVVEVQRTAPYEGMLQVFVGMQGEPRPYRVFLLQDPMRLVVDVRTSA